MIVKIISESDLLKLPKKRCQMEYCNVLAPFSNARLGVISGFFTIIMGACRSCDVLVCSKCAFDDTAIQFAGRGISMLRCRRCGRLLGRDNVIDLFLFSSRANRHENAAPSNEPKADINHLRKLHSEALTFGFSTSTAFRKAEVARNNRNYVRSVLILLDESRSLMDQNRVGFAWCLARLGIVLWERRSFKLARRAFQGAQQAALSEGDIYLLAHLSIVAPTISQGAFAADDGDSGRKIVIKTMTRADRSTIERKPIAGDEKRRLLAAIFNLLEQAPPGGGLKGRRPALTKASFVTPSSLPDAALRGAVYANLSLLQRSVGYLADALLLQEKAFRIWRQDLGASNIAFCQSLQHYSDILFKSDYLTSAFLIRSQVRRIIFQLIWKGPNV